MPYVTTALFAPGQFVRHKIYGYRGLVYDVDSKFDKKTTWLEALDIAAPLNNMPWYHVLVDGKEHASYVSEVNLELTSDTDKETEFHHPLLNSFFERPTAGALSARHRLN